MSNKADLIEMFDYELDILIRKAHNSGLSYWEIFSEIMRRQNQLWLQCIAEHHIKGDTT